MKYIKVITFNEGNTMLANWDNVVCIEQDRHHTCIRFMDGQALYIRNKITDIEKQLYETNNNQDII